MNKIETLFLSLKKHQVIIYFLLAFFMSCTLFSEDKVSEKKQINTPRLAIPPPLTNKQVQAQKTINAKRATPTSTDPVSFKISKKKAYNIYDFGQVKEGNSPYHSFEFKNTTDKKIKILSTRIPCGCADIVINEKILAPGEKTSFRVNLKTKQHRGKISKHFYIFTDSKTMPIIKYTLKADIISKPSSGCLAPALINLKTLSFKELREKKFTIENCGNLDLTLNLRRIPKAIEVKTKLPMTIAPGQKKDFEFILTAPERPGTLYKKLVFFTNEKRRNSILVLIKGEVLK